MAVTRILTQTRPNTGVAFHNASDEFKALKQEMVDAGTLVDNGGGNDESGLERTWTLTFTSTENLNAFQEDPKHRAYVVDREAYNQTNNILETITDT